VLFIKRQLRAAALRRRVRCFIGGRRWRPSPVREREGLLALRAEGLETARPLALCRDDRTGRAAVVIEAVPPTASLKEWIESGALAGCPREFHEGLWREVARIARTLTASGTAWRGFEAKHLYPEVTAEGVRIWLIDCEGVRRTRSAAETERRHAKLLKSLRDARCDEATIAALARELRTFSVRRSTKALQLGKTPTL
jgi:hypothetical protein